MQIRGRHAFPFSAQTVFSTYGDPKHLQAKHQFLGARNIELAECALTDTSLDTRLLREMPVEAPAMLKKFIADWNQITQVEHWTGDSTSGYRGTLEVVIDSVPVSIEGTISLQPEDDGCIQESVLNFSCKIPLVGKKLAEFVAGKSKESMDSDFAFTLDYLKGSV